MWSKGPRSRSLGYEKGHGPHIACERCAAAAAAVVGLHIDMTARVSSYKTN